MIVGTIVGMHGQPLHGDSMVVVAVQPATVMPTIVSIGYGSAVQGEMTSGQLSVWHGGIWVTVAWAVVVQGTVHIVALVQGGHVGHGS